MDRSQYLAQALQAMAAQPSVQVPQPDFSGIRPPGENGIPGQQGQTPTGIPAHLAQALKNLQGLPGQVGGNFSAIPGNIAGLFKLGASGAS